MKHFRGTTWWIGGDDAAVEKAIVTNGRIAFDVTADGCKYTVVLTPDLAAPPWWRADWACRSDGTSGHAEARLYESSEQGVVLVGEWEEQGTYTWITELRP
jgi:hypothetical protein